MDRKATNIVAYLTLVGWFLAYFVGDRYNSRFHLNQALVLNLFFLVLRVVSSVASLVLGWIPLVGWIWMLILLCKDSDPGANQYGENPKGM